MSASDEYNAIWTKLREGVTSLCIELQELCEPPDVDAEANNNKENLAPKSALIMLYERKEKIAKLCALFTKEFQAITDPKFTEQIRKICSGIANLALFIQGTLDSIINWVKDMINSFAMSVTSFWERLRVLLKEAAVGLTKCKIG